MIKVKRPDGTFIEVADAETPENLQIIFNGQGWYVFIEPQQLENYLFKDKSGEIKWIVYRNNVGADKFRLIRNFGNNVILTRREVEQRVKMMAFW